MIEAGEQRQRRRFKATRDADACDSNNNTWSSTSVLAIDEDVLHGSLTRASHEHAALKCAEHVFDAKYLRFTTRR